MERTSNPVVKAVRRTGIRLPVSASQRTESSGTIMPLMSVGMFLQFMTRRQAAGVSSLRRAVP
ncbi:hypothetical protein, partial [Streptomyces xanthophaeus]|uniref:hypothetical protein n=1 Tax=Streptomyces xanthophaeus TaxID=67385 RepID=UPI0036537594